MPIKSAGLLSREQSKNLKDYFNNPITGNETYQAGEQYLQNLLSGGENAYNAFEAPYLQNFQQQILPGIANRFAGAGTGAGALSSSAFNQTAAQAGSTLQAQLAQLRGGLQMQAIPQSLAYAQQPYANQLAGINVRTKENFYQPEQQSGTSSLLGGLAKTALTAGATALAGPAGGALTNLATGLFSPSSGSGAAYDQEFRQRGLPGY